VTGVARRPWLIIVVVAAALVVVALLVLFLIWPAWAYHLDWTGFGASRSPVKSPKALFDYYPSKTLWDWMQLLLIPAVLVVVGFLLSSAQQRRERDIAEKNRAQDLDIAEKNRRADREIAEDRQQEAALGAYLATMTTLLLDKKLRESNEDDEVRAVARAQTLTSLRRLNGERKGSVVRFLRESRLIHQGKVIVNLGGVDLSGADLSWSFLDAANLRGANLSGAILRGSNLLDADLSGASMSGADLSEAFLCDANLSDATMSDTNMQGADLRGADLSDAILRRADLRGAKGKTTEQLECETASLTGATMPNGSIHP